jgi:hypothetical protein
MLTFEQFLQKQWQVESVLDDAMEVEFERWLVRLNAGEMVEYGDAYGAYILDYCTVQLQKLIK